MLVGILDVTYVLYLNNILIFSKNEEDYVRNVKEVLKRLRLYKVYAKLSKYEFYKDSINYLSFVVSKEGITIDPERIKAVVE